MTVVRKRVLHQIWADVIFAIFLREIKSKFSDKLGLGWSVASPMIFIIGLSFVRGMIDGGDTHGMPTFFFMVYGILFIQMFLNTVGAVGTAIKSNKKLFAFRQVQPMAAIIATGFFDLLIKVIVAGVILAFCYVMKMDLRLDDPLLVVWCFVSVWLLAVSIGTLFALGGEFFPELHKLRALIMRPVFFISGIFFSLNDIPREFWYYLDWNPLLHAVELGRGGAYGFYETYGVSLFYLNMSVLTTFTVAIVAYRLVWKQAISR